MVPEKESPKNKLTISYHPRAMVALLERNRYITTPSLMQELECGYTEASWIIMDLMSLQVVSSRDDDWIFNEERMIAERAYRLTEAGRQKKDIFEQRKVELTLLPSLSKMSLETTNDILAAGGASGLEVDNLAEMERTNNPRLTDLLKRRELAVLGEFSPDELRQLTKEIELLKRHSASD